uniref:Inhibitor of growth protein n=1 Tax=Cacopsylla melanoneura TaxID=428564 RepID=A0A8D9BQY1_9HEMI
MLNQAVLEAMYSVPYVETYLDIVENLPDEIQRYLTKIRELDVLYQSYMKEIENLATQNTNKIDQFLRKRNLLRVQVALIAAQEIGDEKLNIMQQVQDVIEGKTRQIDGIFYNLPSVTSKREQEAVESNVRHDEATTAEKTQQSDTPVAPKKRQRKKNETEIMECSSTPLPRSSATIVVTKKPATNTGGKKKKRKTKQQREIEKEASPPPDEDLAIDPNEPTYCLCNQVSFGQMVMCDNDLCPHQWFHFSCVAVTNTPKGKWYCPNCRKARSNAVRPKKQLVERLEKYNKEKQEKIGSMSK